MFKPRSFFVLASTLLGKSLIRGGFRTESDREATPQTRPPSITTVVVATLLLALGAISFATACASSDDASELGVGYDDGDHRILVTFGRELADGEVLHARLRRGLVEDLDCARDAAAIAVLDGAHDRVTSADLPTWRGPVADRALFDSIYDTSWLEQEPTPEMIATAEAGSYVIDVCVIGKSGVVEGRAFDIRRALDRAGGDGKYDGAPEERIASTVAYAELCVAEMGEIPFFEKLDDGDYGTYDCLDSTPIPTTVTDADGAIVRPNEEVEQCDNPQNIYSLCEPNAVDGVTNGPRVASRSNDQGTSWTLLCRKAQKKEGAYNDIAMIGTNPYTGKTCFFQNALYSRTDGLHVPHPADKVASERSPQESAKLWDGIHGGLGSGIACARCHSTDPLIHTPWIDGALTAAGDPVIPKMGIDDDFVLGYNDAPYAVLNAAGQGWTMPKQIVSPEIAACTRCHRIGVGDVWSNSWIRRMVNQDAAWTTITTPAYRTFEHAFWMPPDIDGLDESTWAASEYGQAVAFIQGCDENPACQTAPVPTDPIGDGGSLPTIDLEGRELAVAALTVLGADVQDPSCPNGDCNARRCTECHSVSLGSLKRWRDLTVDAWDECGLRSGADEMSAEQALAAVNCLRVEPSDATSVFQAAKLGILTTGVQYNDFRQLFQKAFGDGAWIAPYANFKARVGMPKGSHPKLSQKDYATLIKWFELDLPSLTDVLDEPAPPQTCVESFDAEAIAAHVEDMSFDGWGAVNAENGIRMYGCAPGADPLTCFGDAPDRTSVWGNGMSNGSVRELTKLGFRTSYWTRSSADGRYVGNGGGDNFGATITDLQTGRDIAVDAAYDPGFFPDNSGFIFQGTMGGAGICAQGILATDDDIDFSESGCMTASDINLYQHVARGTGGGDYFIINSQFVSDSGQADSDPGAYFNVRSTMKLTPMIFNGTTYEQSSATIVDSPYEGDSVLSPSSKLVASRLAGPDGESLGYVIRRVNATRFGSQYAIDIDTKVATICQSGAKPSFSFDERFMVTHHYEHGTANIILVDLLTGARHQLTNMPQGAYAQFPHFRSDGWLYFLVTGDDDEYIAASDAALRIAGQ